MPTHQLLFGIHYPPAQWNPELLASNFAPWKAAGFSFAELEVEMPSSRVLLHALGPSSLRLSLRTRAADVEGNAAVVRAASAVRALAVTLDPTDKDEEWVLIVADGTPPLALETRLLWSVEAGTPLAGLLVNGHLGLGRQHTGLCLCFSAAALSENQTRLDKSDVSASTAERPRVEMLSLDLALKTLAPHQEAEYFGIGLAARSNITDIMRDWQQRSRAGSSFLVVFRLSDGSGQRLDLSTSEIPRSWAETATAAKAAIAQAWNDAKSGRARRA